MRISARAEYGVRAALQLAASRDDGPLKAEAIADAQDVPHTFLESILNDMRRGGLVLSRRGGKGGHRCRGRGRAWNVEQGTLTMASPCL